MINPGIYQHYKGGRYRVLTTCLNSEDPTEILVVYISLQDGTVWARPATMWDEVVELEDGSTRPRFMPESKISFSISDNLAR